MLPRNPAPPARDGRRRASVRPGDPSPSRVRHGRPRWKPRV